MKNKTKCLGIIAIAIVGAFIMTACGLLASDPFGLDTPSEVTATLLSSGNEIHITWKAVSSATRYTIDYRTNLDSADTRRSAGSSTITAYTHRYYFSEDINTLYYYVKAHNYNYTWEEGKKVSDYSIPVSVTKR